MPTDVFFAQTDEITDGGGHFMPALLLRFFSVSAIPNRVPVISTNEVRRNLSYKRQDFSLRSK